MKVFIARFISFIFNPLFVITLAPFFFIYKSTGDFLLAAHWTAYTFAYLLFIAILVVIGVRLKFFTDFDISKREQRPAMFIICIILSIIYLSSLFYFHAPFILHILAIGVILGISLV